MPVSLKSGPKDRREGRRGTTAAPIVLKIAGAAAEAGLDFDSLKKVTQKAVDN